MGAAAAKLARTGGKVTGPGSETSDSVPVRLSKDEFVLPADTVKKVGLPALKALVAATHKHVTPTSKARVRKMANGGLVSDVQTVEPPEDPQANSELHPSVRTLVPPPSVPTAPNPGAVTPNNPGAVTPIDRAPIIPSAPGPAPLPSGQMALAGRGAQEAVDSSLKSGDYGAAVGHAVRGGLGMAGGAVADLANMVTPSVKALGRAAYVMATGNDAAAAPAPAVARLAAPGAPAAAAPAPAGATFNSAADSQAANPPGSSTQIPTVGGASGVTVAGAPGVSKFTSGGRTLYTNVPGDNDLSTGGGVVPSAQNATAAQRLSDTYTASAAAAAQPQGSVYIPGVTAPKTQYEQETEARNASVGSTLTRGGSRQDIAREQMANNLAVARLQAAAGIQGHEISAGASRYSADVTAGSAAARLAQESKEAAPKIQLSQQAVQAGQRLQDLQKQYSAASDPVTRRNLYEQIIAAQGHVRSLSERFTPVSQGSQIDPGTGQVTQLPHLLFDNQTGQWVPAPQGSAAARMSAPSAQAMPASKDKLVTGTVYQTARGPAKWDGSQFIAQ